MVIAWRAQRVVGPPCGSRARTSLSWSTAGRCRWSVMPGMSGRELVDEARKRQPRMKVLFTTGYARNAIVHAGRLDTGVELLPKPFSYAALSARVREVLDKGLGERVLVVEASDSAKGVTAELLNSVGFVVEEAATPREALGKLRAAARYFRRHSRWRAAAWAHRCSHH